MISSQKYFEGERNKKHIYDIVALQLGFELRNDLMFNKVEALFKRIEVNR